MRNNTVILVMMGLLAVGLGAGIYFLFLHPDKVQHRSESKQPAKDVADKNVRDDSTESAGPEARAVTAETPSVTRPTDAPTYKSPVRDPDPVPPVPVPATNRKESFDPRLLLKDEKEKTLYDLFVGKDLDQLLRDHALDILKRQAWREADILRLAIVSRGEDAVPAMIDLVMKNPHFYFNEIGIRVLAEMKQYGMIHDGALADRAVDAIIAAFRLDTAVVGDGKYGTQWWAVYGLTSFGGAKVREALPFGLASPSDRVRMSTLGAMVQVWPTEEKTADEQTDRMFQASVDAVKESLIRDKSAQVQATAAQVLRRLLKDRAYGVLSEVFNSNPQLGVQQAVVMALKGTNQDDVRTFLNQAFHQTPYPEVKRSVLLAISTSNDPESFRTMKNAIADPRPFVAETALNALKRQAGRIPDDSRFLYDIIAIVESKQPAAVRFAAVELLHSVRTKDPAQQEALAGALSSHALKSVEDVLMEKTDVPEKRGVRGSGQPTAYAQQASVIVGYETTEQEDRKIAVAFSLAQPAYSERAGERKALLQKAYQAEPSEAVRRAIVLTGSSLKEKEFVLYLVKELRQTQKWPINYGFIERAGSVLSAATGVHADLDPRSPDGEFESALKQFEAWAKP